MHYVIIGAGPAGVTAAETVRATAPSSEITLVSGEAEPPYSRMAIPYLLQGNIGEEGTYLRQGPDHYRGLGIKVVNARVGGIDTGAKALHLSDGGRLAYGKLLIASGASPVVPRIAGVNLPGVVSCWTLNDARAILKLADKGAPVVLVGAGFIGSIILEALVARGADLTVIELAPRMVARMLDETAGGLLQRWCESKGVRVRTGARVERIETAGGASDGVPLSVALSDGSKVAAKLVVLAAGVRPNAGFLVGANVRTNAGIVIDQHMETSAADVYAAGDVAEGLDLSTGKPEMLAIQPVAVEHGRLAGLNMAGARTAHRGSLNMNVLDTLGLVSGSFGLWDGAQRGTRAMMLDEAADCYLRLEFADNRLVGAQSVGHTDHVGVLRGLIQTGARLGAWEDRLQRAPQRVVEAYIATAQGMPGSGPVAAGAKLPVQAPA